jgi:hypothetical protein
VISYKLIEKEHNIYFIRIARKRDASGHQKALKIAQIQPDEKKITQNRKKEAEQEERPKNKATALMEIVKELVLTTVEIDGLKNDELNLQLSCHREIETRRLAVDGGKDWAESTVEKVPLKSYMEAKHNRVCELKKAVARFLARGETKEIAEQVLSGMDTNTVQTGETTYKSRTTTICRLYTYVTCL